MSRTSLDTVLAVAWLIVAVVNLALRGDPAITMGSIVASLVVARTQRR